MDELELFAFIGSIVFAGWAIGRTATIQYHSLFFSWNPGLGFARLSVWLSSFLAGMTVVMYSASDIVTDQIYIFFYLIMGYALIKNIGQLDPVYRVSYCLDVLERRNSAAGFYLGARTLAMALIFSGSMIGEGPGFYVVLGFFGLGWIVLEIAVYLLCKIRGWKVRESILRDSDIARTSVIAAWYVAIAIILRLACAGDFMGWEIGLRDFAIKASPILVLMIVSKLFSNIHYKQETLITLLYGLFFLFRVPK